jgi:hypothetical protein
MLSTGWFLIWAAWASAEPGWEEAARTEIDGRPLVVHARSRPGSAVKEVRGVGSFDAPPWVVKNVIDDVARYEDFMPWTERSPVLQRGDGFVVSYQRLKMPIVEDRDYVVKIVDESVEDAQGRVVWKNRWTQANELGPPPTPGITRIDVVEGWWQLEELDAGARTKATYYVYTSPGGSIPAGLVNMANARGVPELFGAVAQASRDPRYRAARPVPRRSLRVPRPDPPSLSSSSSSPTSPHAPPPVAAPAPRSP